MYVYLLSIICTFKWPQKFARILFASLYNTTFHLCSPRQLVRLCRILHMPLKFLRAA